MGPPSRRFIPPGRQVAPPGGLPVGTCQYPENAGRRPRLAGVGEALRKGRHRAPKPLSHAVSIGIDRPGTARPRRLHGIADREGRDPGKRAVVMTPTFSVSCPAKAGHPVTPVLLVELMLCPNRSPVVTGSPGRAGR